jgi:hypothetical protein
VERRRNERDNNSSEDSDSYTVSFKHVNPKTEIKVSSGRWVVCSTDGLYHVTQQEWPSAMHTPGVTLVHHPDQSAG